MLLGIIIFVPIFAVVVATIWLSFGYFKRKQKQQIRTMLRKAEESPQLKGPDLLRPGQGDDALSRLLEGFRFTDRLAAMLDQAGSTSTPSKVLTSCAFAALAGAIIGWKFHFAVPVQYAIPAAVFIGGFTPMFLLKRKRSKNIAAFEEQFPEALDFLSRSMRAGHGFSVAMEMLATDAPDPLGRAFRRVSNDTALGSSLDIALGKLKLLVPTIDVQFFVSAVCLQQETGGNLGEILSKLAYIIRERFRLKGQVKAVSAHGRVTGMVLLFMPVAVAIFMMVTNPSYLSGMVDHPIGRAMIWGAIGGQCVGYLVIKKIIDIKV